jgi:hypothetical protein
MPAAVGREHKVELRILRQKLNRLAVCTNFPHGDAKLAVDKADW